MKKTLKLVLLATVVLAVIVAIVVGLSVGFGALGLPISTWPVLFCIFYFSTFADMDMAKAPAIIVGAIVGMAGGYVGPLAVAATGAEVAGLVALLVYVIAVLAFGLSGQKAADAPAMFLFLTITTGIHGVSAAASAAGDWTGLACGVAVILVLGVVGRAKARGQAKEEGEALAG